ncbi:MAG: LemA family protein [bacterium]|nr:LemA family protein [bacterium]
MWIALGIVGFLLLVFVILYNSLVSRKNQVENAFASIDVYLKKRADQIPALVSAVKGYMKHESEVLTKITELRNQAKSNSLGTDDRVDVENGITDSMSRIMIAAEAYPDLKANENFLMLQRSINEIEEQLAASRRAFNASVNDYNNGVETIPMNMVAGMMGYKRMHSFVIPSESRAQYESNPENDL